jgi:hypothetical protein
MGEAGNDLEKERIKITLSFGIMAMSIGLISLVKNFINTSGYSIYIHYLVYCTFGFASIFLILYIILTAARYKSREVGQIEDYYISNGVRNFFYDEAINIFVIGFFITIGLSGSNLFSKLSGKKWVGYVAAGIILVVFLLIMTLLDLRSKRIDKIK